MRRTPAHLKLCASLFLGCVFSTAASAAADAQEPSSSAWEALKARYYGDKPMGMVDEKFMSVEAPANTPDPAATPLTLRFADDAQRRIKSVRVFIDNNPSPLVASFDMGATPLTEIDMRVRIDRFTSVRAIAELADGSLEMRSTWVKASGGCSAPPAPSSGGGKLGEVRLRSTADAKSLQASIRHPNNSGFQIDPKSGDPIPAHYISHIRISTAGGMLLDAETGISLSENPSLRLTAAQALPAPVSVDAVDSETKAHFTASWDGGSITEHASLH